MKARLTLASVALAFVIVLPLEGCPQAGLARTGLAGTWYFQVDRLWDGSGNPGFPNQLLAESTYSRKSNGPTYRIIISGTPGQGYQISIGDPPIQGYQQLTDALQYAFELKDGTFSGGRFLIMHGTDGLEGELTLYGSGLPIIKSERGALLAELPQGDGDSAYTSIRRQYYLKQTEELLAGGDLKVASFYAGKGNYAGAISRLRHIIDNYPDYSRLDDVKLLYDSLKQAQPASPK